MKCTLPNDFEELLSFHMIQWLTFQQALGTYPTAAYLSLGAPNYGSGPNGWQVLWVDCAAYRDTVHALHHVCSTKYFQGAKMCDFRVSYLFSLLYYLWYCGSVCGEDPNFDSLTFHFCWRLHIFSRRSRYISAQRVSVQKLDHEIPDIPRPRALLLDSFSLEAQICPKLYVDITVYIIYCTYVYGVCNTYNIWYIIWYMRYNSLMYNV